MYDFNKNYLDGQSLEGLTSEDLVSFVKSEFTKRSIDRLQFELEWILNINFIEGNQYVEINPQVNVIQPIPKEFWWQVQDVFNQIAPIYETRLAKLGRVTPSLKVRPASAEKDDLSSAKISTKLLEGTFRDQNMRKKVKSANAWLEAAGSVFYKSVWDKEVGKELYYEEMSVREGGITTIVVPPFEIYPDSCYVEDLEDCRSIIHARAYSAKEVQTLFGIKEDGKELTVFSLNKDMRVSSLNARTTVSSMKMDDAVMVYEYTEKPTLLYPKGRVILCTDNQVISAENMTYLVGEGETLGYPFVMCKSIERAGVLWGKSVVTRLAPIQKRYNVIKSRKAEYLNRASIGQMVYEEGSIDEDSLEDEGLAPGAMIPYRRGFNPPRYMEYHGLPSTFETEEANLLGDFNRISGVSEISRDSRAPTGVNSGIALSILQEQDDTRISLTAENIENAHIDLGRLWLRIFKQYAKENRLLRIVGKGDIVELIEWSSSSLTSEDIYIDVSSRLSETPAQRKQMIFDLLNSGLFNDPETGVITKEGRLKVFEMLELGNWESYDDDDNLHVQKANRENIKMATGNQATPVEYDDDLLHIQKHNAYRLTTGFEDLIEKQTELIEVFETHIAMHLQQIQNKMQAQQPQPEGMPQEGMSEGEIPQEGEIPNV